MKIIKELKSFMSRLAIINCIIAIQVLLIPATSFAGQPCRCTQQTVVGTYAGAFEGTLIVTLPDGTKKQIPNAALGLMTIDREGNTSQHVYLVVGNKVMRFGIEPEDPPFIGRITVNPDCTGTLEMSRGEVFEVVVHPRGDEINMIETVSPSGAPTFIGKGKKISMSPDLSRLKVKRPYTVGTYSSQSKGININPDFGPVPSALLGLLSNKHDGTVEFRGTKMVAGTSIPITFADGVWEEGSIPGTGTVTASIMSGDTYMGEYEGWSVILDGGNEIWSISLNEAFGSPIVLGVTKRISFLPTDLE